jgi:hypothetical protein
VQQQPVYTMLYDPSTLPITNFDLSLPAYSRKNSFSSNEQPAAIIIGCIGETSLELIDTDTGNSLGKTTVKLHHDRVTIQPLSIGKSGKYGVRLALFKHSESFKFSVIRNLILTNQAEIKTNAWKKISFQLPPISFQFQSTKPSFINYDARFVSEITQKWYDLLDQTNVPQMTGVVVLKFRQSFNGVMDNIEVEKTTVDSQLVSVCKKALLANFPYQAWPDGMLKKVGANYRQLTFTFNYY